MFTATVILAVLIIAATIILHETIVNTGGAILRELDRKVDRKDLKL